MDHAGVTAAHEQMGYPIGVQDDQVYHRRIQLVEHRLGGAPPGVRGAFLANSPTGGIGLGSPALGYAGERDGGG
jgi:hypothetical protein